MSLHGDKLAGGSPQTCDTMETLTCCSIVEEQELNLVLLRLVDYLGSSNQIVSGVAFNEILLLADALELPVVQLFSPFWRSIAPVIIKDLLTRPQIAQLMADALSISVANLLVLTQTFTLPWLVLTKKKDIIMKIVDAHGVDHNKDPGNLCLVNTNLATIMALLLVQNVPDPEAFILGLMRNISTMCFGTLNLADILKFEPVGIALEILKNLGEEADSKKSRASHSFEKGDQ